MTQTNTSSDYTDNRLVTFNTNFYKLAQQKTSLLMSSPAVYYAQNNKGFAHSVARMGKVDLVDVTGQRNPDKQFTDYSNDNRVYTTKRFTRTILVDKKVDINDLIADPTSDIYANLVAAQNRVADRVIINAASGDVRVGTAETYSTVTAANDGVITVNATAGITQAKIDELTANWINNEYGYEEFSNSRLYITGRENTQLMGLAGYTSADYRSEKPIDKGMQTRIGCYEIGYFAGSTTGGLQVVNPMLPESGTTRTCLVMMPNAVELCSHVDKLEVKESATKVNSMEITIDYWIGAMRLDGSRVQLFTTTF